MAGKPFGGCVVLILLIFKGQNEFCFVWAKKVLHIEESEEWVLQKI